NEYEAVFPIVFNKKFGISYIYQPYFTRYFDVYSQKAISPDQKKEFLRAIPKKFKYARFSLNESSDFKLEGYNTEQRRFQLLALNEAYPVIQKNFSENTKRNIKKGVKENLRIEHSIPPERIVNLFKETKGEELSVFNEEDYSNLNKLMLTCLEKKAGQTIAIYKQEELCAAAFFMYSDNRFVFLKSGVTEAGRGNGAMHMMIDHFIQMHAGTENSLDFGGSSVETVARFYKSFGAQDYVYLQLEKISFLKPIKWMKSLKFKKR
ncbi:MAG TPA: GNAT family N-acetyltransferase, partial [Bacteroidia bacterium]|nr:GNAT family N-acetyltransferase [Bacteroidia bacterium]